MPDNPSASGYTVLSSKVAYESPFTTIRVDEVAMPDGTTSTREIAEHPSAVGAVVIDDDDHVVLLRQYRHSLRQHFLEIPAGKLDAGDEPPEEAMQRELAEEIEMRAGTLTTLLCYTNSAGWTTEQTTVYLATNTAHEPRPDGFELEAEEADMEVVRLPFDDAIDMVRSGDIVDSKTVIGLLAVADRRQP